MSLKILPIIILVGLLAVVSPTHALAVDSHVGNEVVDTFNTTLTRTGSGLAANPYKLQLNLGNANTWAGAQTFNATLNANGTVNLGDGGDAASISGTAVGVNAGDNNATAFYVQQGAIKYLQVKTSNGTENVAFGNTTTNPTFSFLGSGAITFSGPITASTVTSTGAVNANLLTATSINIATMTSSSSVSANGSFTANDAFTAKGVSSFSPAGTADVIVNTDGDSSLVVTGLQTNTGNALCLNASNEVILCSASGGAGSLQAAYDGGNTINSSTSRDITFNLSDTAVDGNFGVNLAATNTVAVSREDNASASAPSQLLLLRNLDTDLSVNKGLAVESHAGGIATAIDASDAEIVTALATGANDVSGTNWGVSGSTGNVQTSGDVNVGGGDLTTTAFIGNIFNTSATTVNIGGGAALLTLGANSGMATIRSDTVMLPNASLVNAMSAMAVFDSVDIGGGHGSTGVTISNSGNVQANGNLTIDGTSSLGGNVTIGADVAVNGGNLTTTASTAGVFNTGATIVNIGGAATTISVGGSSGNTVVNNGLITSGTLTAMGEATFNPGSIDDVTVNTDADSTFILAGLQTATGDGLCIDASNNVIKCSGTPSDVRLKKNITALTNVLPRVLQAQGVRYDLLKEVESAPGAGKNIGFIAQELEVLFPEVVKTDANGIKSVDYEKMTAVLVESTKEQQLQINELKAEVEVLKSLIKEK